MKTSQVTRAAIAYNKAGLSVIPIRLDGSKAPAIKEWGPLMTARPEAKALAKLFAGDCGIAIVGGAVSGGLEIIDFDQAGAFEEWADLLEHVAPGLLARLPVVQTPNGHHVYLRSFKAEGNQKLARSKAKAEGKKDNTKIETRGEGGYVIAPPSPASVHGSGREYVRLQGPKISLVPLLSDEERKILFDTARSFNEVADKEDKPPPRSAQAAGRPGDDFEKRASWSELLEPHGWHSVRSRGDVTHWRRPGKDDNGISATTGYCGDKFYVFSSNAEPFDSGRVYSKFTAYGRLNYGGDFAAAAAELSRLGYGEKRRNSRQEPRDEDAPPFAPPDQGGPAPRHLHAVPDPPRMTAARLEELIADDVGAACEGDVLAALIHIRKTDPAEWARCDQVLRRYKVHRVVAEAAERAQSRGGPQAENTSIKAVLGEVPIPGDPKIPPGYVIRNRGLYKIVERKRGGGYDTYEQLVCDRVPIISAILRQSDGRVDTECVWPICGSPYSWDRDTVPVQSTHMLVQSSIRRGFPGNDGVRAELVQWFADYYMHNADDIEHKSTTEQFGYQRGGGFVLGERYIGPEESSIGFRAAGAGESQWARQLAPGGTYDGWIEAISSVNEFPRVAAALYAALAPPLLKILGAKNFAVEWAGATSGGKSTAITVASSVWGEPGSDGLVKNWSGTKIGIERYFAAMSDLPTFLDDTQTARRDRGGRAQVIEDVLYQLTSSGGLRGDKEGSREALTWRTVLLSTGEQSMAETVQGGGAAARVLTIWGSPFEGHRPTVVRQLEAGLADNYGHAGARWIEYIIANAGEHKRWREFYKILTERYRERLAAKGDPGIAGRLASCAAVIGLAAYLAGEALGLPWDTKSFDPLALVVEDFARESDQASRPKAALADCASSLASRLHEVIGAADVDLARPPSAGWLGKLDSGSLYLFGTALARLLDDLGYQSRSIIRQWADGAVIVRGDEGRIRTQLKFSGRNVSAYRIDLAALAEAGLDLRPAQPSLGGL